MTGDKSSSALHKLVFSIAVSPLTPQDERALQVVLADFLACVQGAPAVRSEGESLLPAGGEHNFDRLVTELAVNSCLRDRDDIDWRASVHPGSIIWPVVMAIGVQQNVEGRVMLQAAAAGYRAISALAQMLGPAHAARYHPTGVAGAFGAAMAAGIMFGLEPDQLVAAAAHSISASGGLGQAVIERSSSMVFHRVGATNIGVLAAQYASRGLAGSDQVLEGARGAFAILGGGTVASARELDIDPAGVSVRIYPVNGFAQGAVERAAQLGALAAGSSGSTRSRPIIVQLSSSVIPAVTGKVGGDWWDIRSAVAAAFSSGDAFNLAMTPEARVLRDLVHVRAADMPAGYCTVGVGNPEASESAPIPPPGQQIGSPATRRLLNAKWARLLETPNAGDALLQAAAAIFLRGGPEARQVLSGCSSDAKKRSENVSK